MYIRQESLPDINRLIRLCYSTAVSDDLLREIARIICRILRSDYYALHLFHGYLNHIPLYISNNPADFLDLYVQIAVQDYYKNMGLDPDSGIPSVEVLKMLGLDSVIQDLHEKV